MKKRLSLLALAVLSSIGVSAGAAQGQGPLPLNSGREENSKWTYPPMPPPTDPPAIAGVRG